MIYLDKNKITLEQIKEILINQGFNKTSSKRFIRYEKIVNKWGDYWGIEITTYNSYYELRSYATATLGIGITDTITSVLYPLFKDYEFIW